MADMQQYQTKEVLNKVLNTGEDALKVDIDNVTLDADQLNINLDSADDSVTIEHPITGIAEGSVTDASTGTAISGAQVCKRVDITAKTGNTDTVWVGGSSISSGNGTPLESGDSYSLEIDDLSNVYIFADTNGEGVTFTYFT